MSKNIWPPFTSLGIDYSPKKIVKGKGPYLYDEDGKSYFDAISSWWVNAHGHSNDFINDALKKQVDALEHCIFADFTHDAAENLADDLVKHLPINNAKVFFSDNGSTSVEVAIKMAIQAKYNKGEESNCILSLSNAYHGDTFGAMSVANNSTFFSAFAPYMFDVVSIDLEKEELDEKALDALLKDKKVAALVYEPLVQGAGGMRMPDIDRYNSLLKYCKNRDIYLVADEVMTGFGRCESLFASEQLEIKPDVICLSKCLTGGYLPMGLSCAAPNIWEAFLDKEPSKTFYHGHSYTANPLACAVANASLELSTSAEGKANRKRISKKFEAFKSVLDNSDNVFNCRHRGCILVFEVGNDATGYVNNITPIIKAKAVERGILLRPLGNTLYFMPPFVSTDEQLDHLFAETLALIKEL